MQLNTFTEFLNESKLNEDSKVKDRIKELAADAKNQEAMGSTNTKNLEYAFQALFNRGYGAAKTNWGAVHPTIKAIGKGVAAYNAWGHARLNAFINKAKAYNTSDKDVADWLKGKGDKPTLTNEAKKPTVGHTRKRKHYKDDPPDIGLYSKGGRDAIKGTGYADKAKAEFTIKELDKLMKQDERTWAMSIATTMESRAKKHKHQTQGMRDAMKVFRTWIDKNKLQK